MVLKTFSRIAPLNDDIHNNRYLFMQDPGRLATKPSSLQPTNDEMMCSGHSKMLQLFIPCLFKYIQCYIKKSIYFEIRELRETANNKKIL